ncbi:rhodanese-like domain-containing protein [Edaphobacter sp. HDX4]|uniref:rhodanese-like domain-containing protein n=1 Tax=Edaphobacter sp. HDX4 TaxID=2794064 RepID=UPI002FE6B5FA
MLYGTAMTALALLVLAGIGGVVWALRRRRTREIEQHFIDADALRPLLEPDAKILLFDVRQPLDLLARSEMIPGAKRIPPKEILANPSLIPADVDAVLYCTCEGQKTSRQIVEHGLKLGFSRVRLLRGGLGAWKAKGYPVVPYTESFRLDTAV